MVRILSCILILSIFFCQSNAVLRCVTHIHKESGPEVWGFGDQHIDYLTAEKACFNTEKEQGELICNCLKKYKGKEPIHIFFEASEKRLHLVKAQSILLDKLKELRTIARGTVHKIEDFDLRRIIHLAIALFDGEAEFDDISEECLEIFRSLNATKTLTDYAISNESTFQDVWEEIERYHYTISFACKNYFGDTFENSKAEEYLNEAYKLYRELLECCQIHDISSTDRLKATGNLLVREPKIHNNISLRRHLLLTLLNIGCYLTDVALYLKVRIVHESGARVIVIAGASHIRRLQELLINSGFCGGEDIHIGGPLYGLAIQDAFEAKRVPCTSNDCCFRAG